MSNVKTIVGRCLTAAGKYVLVVNDLDAGAFAAGCDVCGPIDSRTYSPNQPGDVEDTRALVDQAAADHAAACRWIVRARTVDGAR